MSDRTNFTLREVPLTLIQVVDACAKKDGVSAGSWIILAAAQAAARRGFNNPCPGFVPKRYQSAPIKEVAEVGKSIRQAAKVVKVNRYSETMHKHRQRAFEMGLELPAYWKWLREERRKGNTDV